MKLPDDPLYEAINGLEAPVKYVAESVYETPSCVPFIYIFVVPELLTTAI